MKAHEIPKKPSLGNTAPVNPTVTEAKQSKVKKHHKPESHVAPFGVDDPQGHVMRRIQAAKPHLMTKLNNWD